MIKKLKKNCKEGKKKSTNGWFNSNNKNQVKIQVQKNIRMRDAQKGMK